MSDIEPIILHPRRAVSNETPGSGGVGVLSPQPLLTRFTRIELNLILRLYGRMVAAGEWRDYAIDLLKDRAVFSVYRRACEYALYRIEKNPRLARKQGAYSVVTATGLVLKRGHDLRLVIAALDTRLKLVSGGTGGEVSFA